MDQLRTFLAAHSKVFQELTEDATIDELLTGYDCDRNLLARLPALYKDKLKLSNCLIDAAYPYDSLVGCNMDELVALVGYVDYLYLPSSLTYKLNRVIVGGIDCDKYTLGRVPFDKTNTADWVSINDYRGMHWAIEQGYSWNEATAESDATHGNLDILKMLHEAGCPMTSDIFRKAAVFCNLDVLEWLKSINCPMHYSAYECAARRNRLDILNWLHSVECPLPTGATACSAAAHVSLECLEWLHKKGYPWNSYTYSAAAESGRIDCLRYMDKHECPKRSYACFLAAKNGHSNTLKYLYKHNRHWGREWKYACAGAAAGGKLEILKLLHEHNYPWDKETCKYAALYGHLDCLQYAHTHGCPWDQSICAAAAWAGRLDCLQYAHQQGCPWDHTTIEKAKKRNKQACLDYAIANGCPSGDAV